MSRLSEKELAKQRSKRYTRDIAIKEQEDYVKRTQHIDLTIGILIVALLVGFGPMLLTMLGL